MHVHIISLFVLLSVLKHGVLVASSYTPVLFSLVFLTKKTFFWGTALDSLLLSDIGYFFFFT